MCSTLNRAITLQDSSVEQSNAKNGKSKSKSKKQQQQRQQKQKPLEREVQLNRALQELCGGLYKTVCALKMEGRLKQPWSPGMNSEQIRYEHRFAPFNNVLAPPSVSYGQYKEMEQQINASQQPNQLYVMACTCFSQAKMLLENITDPDEEISSYLKVAKTNFVVIKLLLTGQVKGSKVGQSKKIKEMYSKSINKHLYFI
jgi:hypothetical protein